MRILLDTSFLMLPFEKRVDIYEEIKYGLGNPELFTLSVCINELEKLNKAAIDLLEKKGVKIIESKGSADKALIKVASKERMVLATIDRKLKEIAKRKGVRVVFFRKKRSLEVE